MKVLITISYDGTEYCGWQSQRSGATIQSVVECAVSRLYDTPVKILGASRTDSGVHALCQKASFTPPDDRIQPERLFPAINASLPHDIRVVSSEPVPDRFHVINDVKRKTYTYTIQNTAVYDPIKYRYAYHVKEHLDLEAMEEASAFFLGKHDFKAFCAARSGAATTVRTIYKLSPTCKDGFISLEICGSGFLYNMVRIIAGTLVEIGRGKLSASSVEDIIESRERAKAGKTLPAKGLTLIDIEY